MTKKAQRQITNSLSNQHLAALIGDRRFPLPDDAKAFSLHIVADRNVRSIYPIGCCRDASEGQMAALL